MKAIGSSGFSFDRYVVSRQLGHVFDEDCRIVIDDVECRRVTAHLHSM